MGAVCSNPSELPHNVLEHIHMTLTPRHEGGTNQVNHHKKASLSAV